jgi:hypothetical protein
MANDPVNRFPQPDYGELADDIVRNKLVSEETPVDLDEFDESDSLETYLSKQDLKEDDGEY